MKLSSSQLFVIIVSMVVIGVIGLGVSLIDSPSLVRSQKLDEKRVQDLGRIEREINNYYKDKKSLPSQLQSSDFAAATLKDPVTQHPYEYKMITPASYSLCTVFDAAVQNVQNNLYKNSYCFNQRHNAGKQCCTVSLKPSP